MSKNSDTVLNDPEKYGYSRWSLRLWHGMTFGAWRSLFKGNLRRIPLSRLDIFLSVTVFSFGNSFLSILSNVLYGKAVSRTQIKEDPVFVLGYARSGTTWLHQVLSCDPRQCSPTSLQVFMPETFLILRKVMGPISHLWLPESRPMDNVKLTPESSEEDEVAMLVLGAPTSMRPLAFGGQDDPNATAYLQELSEESQAAWKKKWLTFLRKIQMVNPGKRLLLKSPPHAVRVDEILRIFPNAKFVHIVRDPYKVAVSNLKMLPAMIATQCLTSNLRDKDAHAELLLEGFVKFNDAFEASLPKIPEGNIVTIKYEDLRKDTLGVVKQIYKSLDLGSFSNIETPLEGMIEQRKGYVLNTFSIDKNLEASIDQRWKRFFDRYDYLPLSQRAEPKK